MPGSTTLRFPDPLKTEASEYAESLGISLNALVAVALREYLDQRQPSPSVSAEVPPLPIEEPPWQDERPPVPAEPVRRRSLKVGRNDPCPCGSGKKYKVCCGR